MTPSFRAIASFAGTMLACVLCAHGGEPAFVITDSQSPDGKLELWIKPIDNGGEMAEGIAEIRAVNSQKIVGMFHWSGFGVRPVLAPPPFSVLWRKDNKFFAIKWEISRGWMSGAVYGKDTNGRWKEVLLPSDEYSDEIIKRAGVNGTDGKGFDVPQEWLSNDEIAIQFEARTLGFSDGDPGRGFLVTLKVADKRHEPLAIAKIESITLLSGTISPNTH